MKRIYYTMLVLPLLLLSACGDDVQDSKAPQADYPFKAPELDENPPMSSDEIDRIDSETSKETKGK